jgi:hypothetical protein
MTTIADELEHRYRTAELAPEHVLRRAVAELRLLREERDRLRAQAMFRVCIEHGAQSVAVRIDGGVWREFTSPVRLTIERGRIAHEWIDNAEMAGSGSAG